MPDFSAIPIVKLGPCYYHQPGHAANVTRARVCWSLDRGVHEIELVEITLEAVVVRDGNQILRLLNHDLDLIRKSVNDRYEGIYLASNSTLLTLEKGRGYVSFSVKLDDGEPLGPCSFMHDS